MVSPPLNPVSSSAVTKPSERRQHRRVPVKKMFACIPPPDGIGPDDVVETLDISRGGAKFRSKKSYVVGQWVQVAVPYMREAVNIFTQARIAWRTTLADNWNEYGLKYVKVVTST